MLSDSFFWLSLLSLGGALYLLLQALLLASWARRRQMPTRTTVDTKGLPSLAVLLAARDEEESIGRTLESLVTDQSPPPRVIVVNDRSHDRTGEVIARLAARDDRIVPVQVRALPEGWLGKCHALHRGAARLAEEEWILFTDADVTFAPGVLAEAVAEAERAEADHFVLFPRLEWGGPLEGSLLNLFSLLLGIGFRFRSVESDDPEAFVGIGAFNMIRRSLYDRIGRHRPLRMEVADDMKLGYLAKVYGGRSTARYGGDRVRVRWRRGTFDTVRGIARSAFPGMNFHWGRLLWGTTGILLVFVLPVVLLLLLREVASPSSVLSLASLVSGLSAVSIAARREGVGLLSILLTPLAALLFAWGILYSGFSITKAGGVWWRETFYSIDDLRHGSVR